LSYLDKIASIDPSLAGELKKINVYTIEASNVFNIVYSFFINSSYTPFDYSDPLSLNLVYTLAMNSVSAPRLYYWEKLVESLSDNEKRDLLARLKAYTHSAGNAVIIDSENRGFYVVVAVNEKDVQNLEKLVKAKK
jgi:hypothetical protein